MKRVYGKQKSYNRKQGENIKLKQTKIHLKIKGVLIDYFLNKKVIKQLV